MWKHPKTNHKTEAPEKKKKQNTAANSNDAGLYQQVRLAMTDPETTITTTSSPHDIMCIDAKVYNSDGI